MSLEYLVYRTMMLSPVQICMIPLIGHRYIHVHVRMIAYLVFACSFVHDFVCVGLPRTVFVAAQRSQVPPQLPPSFLLFFSFAIFVFRVVFI